MPDTLTPQQLAIIQQPLDAKIFLEGPAGSGKTTAAAERLLSLIQHGIPAGAILLLAPQRTLAEPYMQVLQAPGVMAGGIVTPLTLGGLARRMVELFWPLVAETAGFAHPEQPPVFLTLETAQYAMAHLVQPLFEQGYFESLTIDRNRIYSQVIDNLNKAALVGFPYTEIVARLKAAWSGQPGQAHVYDDAQDCAVRFRQHCLAHNLLDFSLQVEVFCQYLWPAALCREYLQTTYRHLVVDNLEEDTPVTHDLLRDWLPRFQSALLVYDEAGGYRRFLGADPESGHALRDLCDEHFVFTESLVATPSVQSLTGYVAETLLPMEAGDTLPPRRKSPVAGAAAVSSTDLVPGSRRFFPQMVDWAADEIQHLVVEEGMPPGEIVVLTPFLSDALRFALLSRLEARGIPAYSHRPSRALQDEPAAQCLLTLAALAHPQWSGQALTAFDVAYALVQSIGDMDLVRARLLADIIYRPQKDGSLLSSFDMINPDMQQRITYRLGERYERLRLWLEAYRHQPEPAPLDHFFSRLFGEVLSQAGFGFHTSFANGAVVANLIESVQKFRWVAAYILADEEKDLGKEYVQMVQAGVLAAQYLRSWQSEPADAVLLAPAYTFLLSNRPVNVQLWLDIGSRGWSERLQQPLTQPYVLSRHWQPGQLWTEADEFARGQETMAHLVLGLLRRCRQRIYLGYSELGEQGFEQRGPLVESMQRLLQQLSILRDDKDV